MRVALITETFPPEINGVAMTLSRLVDGLTERGHSVEVIRPRQNKTDLSTVNGRLEHFTLPGIPLPKYDGLKFGLPAKRKLIERWRYRRPDIVHIATEGPLGYSALRAAQKLNIPIASSFHTNFQQYGKHYGYGFLHRYVMKYLRYFHNQTAATMTPSNDMLKLLVDEGYSNVSILARGVDTDLYSPDRRSVELRRSWGLADNDIALIYVGRVAEEKNIPLIIKTWQHIKQTCYDTKLIVVGDGPALSPLQSKYPGIIFTGAKRGEELATHYASGDIFLFASETETFGNVVTEALASGLAVVTYNYAAADMHMTHDVNGFTPTFADPNHFIRCVNELINDPVRVARFRIAARESSLKISWNTVADEFISRLRAIIESEPTNPVSTGNNTTSSSTASRNNIQTAQ
ncbi:glycosyltransferase family 4 protein [Poriferisphaera sp. WC338]|uniref:glycosyltransferase family 4 protein n=1 Tax=Poriferisphaera sp. WC338 TaxID=3425129 RepID=UPI003D817109